MVKPLRGDPRRARTLIRFVVIGLACVALAWGCSDLLNPSFLRLFETPGSEGDTTFSAVEAPTGHVPILFKNTARLADNVLRFVIQADSVPRPEVVDELLRVNPQLTREAVEALVQALIDGSDVDLEPVNIPPRVRLTVDVTNVDGGVQRLEFLDGLRLARQETQGAQGGGPLPQDLTENTNNTFVVQCDIMRIDIVRVDVFIPVILRTIADIFNNNGQIIGEFCTNFLPLIFDDLEADEGFDVGQGEFQELRNYDPRFFPPALTTLQCGAVVVLELTGELSLPFRDVPTDCEPPVNPPADGLVPGFRFVDLEGSNQIPGRYGLRIIVRGQ